MNVILIIGYLVTNTVVILHICHEIFIGSNPHYSHNKTILTFTKFETKKTKDNSPESKFNPR